MRAADFEDEAVWAEAAAANDALEALARAKLLARRRLALHQSSKGAPPRRVVALGGGGALYIGVVAADGRTPHGDGALLLPDGSQHVGAFSGGRVHGTGVFQAPSGAAAVGAWEDNKRVGAFAAVDAFGHVFAERYAEDGRRVAREARGLAPHPPILCERCGMRYVPELNHAYGCRRHPSLFLPDAGERAVGLVRAGSVRGRAASAGAGGEGPGPDTYRRLISAEELARRGQPRAAEQPLAAIATSVPSRALPVLSLIHI